MKPVDKSKYKNVKCEHCDHWNKDTGICSVQHKHKNYYQMCKQFDWDKNREYELPPPTSRRKWFLRCLTA